MKIILLSLALSMICFILSIGQDYNGTFLLKTDEADLTLRLQEGTGGVITGTLESTKGAAYQLQGEVQEGVAMGVCSDNQSGVYFEAYLDGNNLSLGLIEPDQFNMPDYNTARYFVFEKQGNSGSKPSQANSKDKMMEQQPATIAGPPADNSRQTSAGIQHPAVNSSPPATGSSNIGTNEAGDPSWGWKFALPQGWKSQKNNDGIFLGHNTIAGLIIVLPHMSENMQQLQQEMLKGINEEGNYLQLKGSLESVGNGMLGGEYSGMMDGTQVNARGIGTLSPFGGGAVVIAVTTPEKYGSDIKNIAGTIAKNMVYFKPAGEELIPYFAGKWTGFTKNTSTYISLYPDGRYGELYESSYSGELSGGGNWGTAGQNDRGGRWTVRGNKEQGQIIIKLNNGNEIIYNYRVHVENGTIYSSEYYFNGSLYSKQRF